jgi:hypothetical protein
MIEGNLSREGDLKTLPLSMTVSSLRRKKLLELIMNPQQSNQNLQDNVKGFARLIANRKDGRQTQIIPKSNLCR